jgi:predicted nucleotidyltransferase
MPIIDETDFGALLRALDDAGVEFIVIGGAAATAFGSARLTLDLDVVYRRTKDNLARLVKAFQGLTPYLRGAPPGLPFHWDEPTITRGLNFTLTTNLGSVDLLGEITAGGSYEELLPHTVRLTVFGVDCQCIKLSKLIEVKKAVGRPKDLEVIAELEAIQEELDEGGA